MPFDGESQGTVLFTDVRARQAEPAHSRQRHLHPAPVGVAGLLDSPHGRPIEAAVGIAEAIHRLTQQPAQQVPAVLHLSPERGMVQPGQPHVRQPMGANLDIVRPDLTKLILVQQRQARLIVPFVLTAQQTRHDEQRGREAVSFQNGQRRGQEVPVSVVERQADQPGGFAVLPGLAELADRHTPQAVPMEPVKLLREALRGDADPVQVPIHPGDRVVHQDGGWRMQGTTTIASPSLASRVNQLLDLADTQQAPGRQVQHAHDQSSKRQAQQGSGSHRQELDERIATGRSGAGGHHGAEHHGPHGPHGSHVQVADVLVGPAQQQEGHDGDSGGVARGQALDAEEGKGGQAHDDRDHEPDQGGAGRVPGGRPTMPDGEQRQDDDVHQGLAQQA